MCLQNIYENQARKASSKKPPRKISQFFCLLYNQTALRKAGYFQILIVNALLFHPDGLFSILFCSCFIKCWSLFGYGFHPFKTGKTAQKQGMRGFADGSVHRRTRARQNVNLMPYFKVHMSFLEPKDIRHPKLPLFVRTRKDERTAITEILQRIAIFATFEIRGL